MKASLINCPMTNSSWVQSRVIIKTSDLALDHPGESQNMSDGGHLLITGSDSRTYRLAAQRSGSLTECFNRYFLNCDTQPVLIYSRGVVRRKALSIPSKSRVANDRSLWDEVGGGMYAASSRDLAQECCPICWRVIIILITTVRARPRATFYCVQFSHHRHLEFRAWRRFERRWNKEQERKTPVKTVTTIM